METNLRSLLLDYYRLSQQLKQANQEYLVLESNNAAFSNQTNVEEIQAIINYKNLLTAKTQETSKITTERGEKETAIVELFSLAGIPVEHKIDVPAEDSIISFWFDKEEDLQYTVAGNV